MATEATFTVPEYVFSEQASAPVFSTVGYVRVWYPSTYIGMEKRRRGMGDVAEAVTAFKQVGLTEYEARCFVALSRVPKATAKEISQLADVPRSRVYDTMERLHQRGLVEIHQSEPREFRAVSRENAIARLEEEYATGLQQANESLAEVESAKSPEEKGVWAIANPDQVGSRAEALIDDADESIHILLTDRNVLQERTLARIATAIDREVSVVIEVPSTTERDHLHQAIPGAQIVIAEGLGETKQVVKKWPGQLLLADGEAVLATGIEESDLPGITTETAVWSHGLDHGFAAWIRELLQDRLATLQDQQ